MAGGLPLLSLLRVVAEHVPKLSCGTQGLKVPGDGAGMPNPYVEVDCLGEKKTTQADGIHRRVACVYLVVNECK